MYRTAVPSLAALVLALGLAACSEDETADTTPEPDTGADAGTDAADDDAPPADATDAPESDTTTGLDVEVETPVTRREVSDCGENAAILAWSLVEQVAETPTTVTVDGEIRTVTLDASAGGSMSATSNPFVYFDFDAGEAVLIDDLTALDDRRWELAFRRVYLRSNSGHSGPGAVELGRVLASSLDEVTSTAPVVEWEIDEFFDSRCTLYSDPLGNPLAAINYLNLDNPSGSDSWYDYQGGVSPVAGHIYLVRGSDGGGTYAFQITSWESGVYTFVYKALAD